MALNRTIALVGMMGAGKTSIGRRLATRLGVPFRDADHESEAAATGPGGRRVIADPQGRADDGT